AGAVSRAASAGAWRTDANGAAGGNAGLRRLECHGAGGSPRIARSHSPPALAAGSAREGAGSHPDRIAAASAAGRAQRAAPGDALTVVAGRSSGARAHPQSPARVGAIVFLSPSRAVRLDSVMTVLHCSGLSWIA